MPYASVRDNSNHTSTLLLERLEQIPSKTSSALSVQGEILYHSGGG